MELTGTRIIAAPRDVVWTRLNDADTLRACIPGCEELTGNAEDGFEAVVKQKVGPVKATFRGAVTVSDANPPESYRIAGEGKGGVAGFAKGAADVRLAEVPEGTELTYVVDAKVGGKIAQLGSRLIDSFSAKMADSFFETFKAEVEGRDGAQDPVT
ncbi:carbon monoxide dehydrogenase subunit G [Jannaschia sp. S6380]|uniref:CoxG family protein n=1 Tax=Jannaschia sp. S6380 TaxID=2926408 RepID=UPI001FF3F1DA|nr:carbon monoxide dehydrogenase subunit G [Jannaschia sp. S6380]MCK0167290.1 carbon monoxide dehydrogenase subunit G [Jannaschia sp. S6380]